MKESFLCSLIRLLNLCISCVRILERCRNLTELNLGWTELGQETVARVCGLLGPGLRRLCLAGNR